MSSPSLRTSSSELRSGSNAASAVGSDPVMTAQTTPRSVQTLTSPPRSSASMASNAPPRIAMTWIPGSPHLFPTALANAAIWSVSFAM